MFGLGSSQTLVVLMQRCCGMQHWPLYVPSVFKTPISMLCVESINGYIHCIASQTTFIMMDFSNLKTFSTEAIKLIQQTHCGDALEIHDRISAV